MDFKLYKINKRDVYIFLFTIVIGLFAHGFIVFNKISFLDDLSSLYGFSAKHLFSLGRFTIALLKIINDKLFNSFSSPIINGIISLIFIAFSNILIARIFDIKKNTNLILLSSVMILSTGYICLQAYSYTAVYYSFAIFLSILSTYLFLNYRFKNKIHKIFIIALLQMLVISIYQSYFLFGILIFIIYQICDLLNDKFELKITFEYFRSVLLSLLLYFSVNKLVIFSFSFLNQAIPTIDSAIAISNYQGISQFLNLKFWSVLSFNALFLKLFIPDTILFGNNYYIYILIYLLAKGYLSIKSFVLVVIYTFLLVAISNALYILNGVGTSLYALPMFPKCLLFLYPVILLEKYSLKINLPICVLLFYYLTYNTVLANNIYLNKYLTLENEKRWCNTLVTRIQSTPGYSDEYDIYIYGEKIGPNIIKHDNHYVDNRRFFKSISPYDTSSINQYNFESFLEYYSGFKAWTFHINDKSFNTDIVIDMPCYPNDGSIRVIDKRIIVKFSNLNIKT
ncbi:MAG: glucosyltransferase domain-containing protein [Lachnospiraceae bacterium]|nr:glucosyltransferase domain-containing protein [Lachnospiraceae bacterium]